MKYLIISIYDDGYGFGICDGGSYIEKYQYCDYRQQDDNVHEICMNYHQLTRKSWQEWLKENYEDYSLITVCQDGEITVLVDRTKNTEKD